MGKRQTSLSSTREFKHPRKTAKRLATKRALLEARKVDPKFK